MERLNRYLPLVVILGICFCLVLFFYANNRLGEAIDRLETAEEKLDSTLAGLTLARTRIDSVQHELIAFGAYVHDIQGRVEILDLSRRTLNDAFRNQQSAINVRLKTLYRELDVTGQELPEIPVVRASSSPAKQH